MRFVVAQNLDFIRSNSTEPCNGCAICFLWG